MWTIENYWSMGDDRITKIKQQNSGGTAQRVRSEMKVHFLQAGNKKRKSTWFKGKRMDFFFF